MPGTGELIVIVGAVANLRRGGILRRVAVVAVALASAEPVIVLVELSRFHCRPGRVVAHRVEAVAELWATGEDGRRRVVARVSLQSCQGKYIINTEPKNNFKSDIPYFSIDRERAISSGKKAFLLDRT